MATRNIPQQHLPQLSRRVGGFLAASVAAFAAGWQADRQNAVHKASPYGLVVSSEKPSL